MDDSHGLFGRSRTNFHDVSKALGVACNLLCDIVGVEEFLSKQLTCKTNAFLFRNGLYHGPREK